VKAESPLFSLRLGINPVDANAAVDNDGHFLRGLGALLNTQRQSNGYTLERKQ